MSDRYHPYDRGREFNYDDDYARGGGGDRRSRPRRSEPRPRDDDHRRKKLDPKFLQQRRAAERESHTLFCRNVSYTLAVDELRERFSQYGEVKEVFDMISTRGLAFVTFYNLRSAIRAKDAMNGAEVNGRTIDVHYSLPKNKSEATNNGTLLITSSASPISRNSVNQEFGKYGEVRNIFPASGNQYADQDRKWEVQYYDTRDSEQAYHANSEIDAQKIQKEYRLPDNYAPVPTSGDYSEREEKPRPFREPHPRDRHGEVDTWVPGERGRGRNPPPYSHPPPRDYGEPAYTQPQQPVNIDPTALLGLLQQAQQPQPSTQTPDQVKSLLSQLSQVTNVLNVLKSAQQAPTPAASYQTAAPSYQPPPTSSTSYQPPPTSSTSYQPPPTSSTAYQTDSGSAQANPAASLTQLQQLQALLKK